MWISWEILRFSCLKPETKITTHGLAKLIFKIDLSIVLPFISSAIAIKESAKVGDQAQRRAAKGITDLGK